MRAPHRTTSAADWTYVAVRDTQRSRSDDLALVGAASLGSVVFLLGFSPFTAGAPVMVSLAMFVLVRFTSARWQSLVIAATVPEVTSTLVTILRFPDNSEAMSYGEPITYSKAAAACFAVLFLILVTASGWLADRLRTVHQA